MASVPLTGTSARECTHWVRKVSNKANMAAVPRHACALPLGNRVPYPDCRTKTVRNRKIPALDLQVPQLELTQMHTVLIQGKNILHSYPVHHQGTIIKEQAQCNSVRCHISLYQSQPMGPGTPASSADWGTPTHEYRSASRRTRCHAYCGGARSRLYSCQP